MILGAMALKGLFAGRPLGEQVYRGVALLLIVSAVLWSTWNIASSAWYAWRTDVWKDRAIGAAQAAKQAQANAASADEGAANATYTRQQMDSGTVTVRVETDHAAKRIETYAQRPAPVADLDPVDPDIVRELAAGEDRLRAAADRLQRARSR